MLIQPNSLYHVDCLTLLERVDDGVARTIYLDPPWFGQPFVGERGLAARVASGLRDYLENFSRVLQQCHRILADNGSVMVHVEPSLGLKLTLLLRQVFGDNYVDEYVLLRFGNSKGKRHESLLHYGKSPNTLLNVVHSPVVSTEREANPDNDRRGPWRAVDLMTRLERPSLQFEWRGSIPPAGRSWRYALAELERLAADGRIYFPDTGRAPQLKVYAAEQDGVPVGTVWDDICPVVLRDNERVGYPMQQPVALMERIVKRTSNSDDIVMDPYCGSGTSLVAAHRQGRRWIGCDVSPKAIDCCRGRLRSEGLSEGRDWQVHSMLDLTAIEPKPMFLRRIVTMIEDLNAAEVLIAEGESEWVERKVTACWNSFTCKKDENSKEKFIRSVAAFLNSREGGTLLIGVADDGRLPGLIEDYKAANSQRPGRDTYELWLRQTIGDRIGKEFGEFVRISFEEVRGQDVCVVRIAAGNRPACTREKLPIRRGNQTIDLSLKDAIEYSRSRWPL